MRSHYFMTAHDRTSFNRISEPLITDYVLAPNILDLVITLTPCPVFAGIVKRMRFTSVAVVARNPRKERAARAGGPLTAGNPTQ